MIALFSMFMPYYTFRFAMLISFKCYIILSLWCFHFSLQLSFAFRSNLSACCLHRAAVVFCWQSCNEMVPVANVHVCRRYVSCCPYLQMEGCSDGGLSSFSCICSKRLAYWPYLRRMPASVPSVAAGNIISKKMMNHPPV